MLSVSKPPAVRLPGGVERGGRPEVGPAGPRGQRDVPGEPGQSGTEGTGRAERRMGRRWRGYIGGFPSVPLSPKNRQGFLAATCGKSGAPAARQGGGVWGHGSAL